MKVKIKETGELKELGFYDESTGQDTVEDFLGQQGALNYQQFLTEHEILSFESGEDTIHQFMWSTEEEVFVAFNKTFEWWFEIVEKAKKMENRIAEAKKAHGAEAVESAIYLATINSDIDVLIDEVNSALDELEGGEETL